MTRSNGFYLSRFKTPFLNLRVLYIPWFLLSTVFVWTLISKAGLERFLHTYFSLVQNMWNSDFECCWYLQTSKAAQKWFNSGSEARHGSEAGGDSLDRHGTETGDAAASRRDHGSDEKYSDINGRLSRKTGRPGHCHYIQVKFIQNLNLRFFSISNFFTDKICVLKKLHKWEKNILLIEKV